MASSTSTGRLASLRYRLWAFALHRPERTAYLCAAFVAALLVALAAGNLYIQYRNVLGTQTTQLEIRAVRLDEHAKNAVRELRSMRAGVENLLADPNLPARFEADPTLVKAFEARNETTWAVPGTRSMPPILGVGPDVIQGLEGFDRNELNLPADLVLARLVREVLGRIAAEQAFSDRVIYLSRNGVLVATPTPAGVETAGLVRLLALRRYFLEALPGKNPARNITWGDMQPAFGREGLAIGLALPVYKKSEFRGVMITAVRQASLERLITTDATVVRTSHLLRKDGVVLATVGSESRANADLTPTLRAIVARRSFDETTNIHDEDGNLYLFRWINTDWLLVDVIPHGRLYLSILRSVGAPVIISGIVTLLLMIATMQLALALLRQQVEQKERMQHLAERDPLTGLSNRRHLAELFAVAQRDHLTSGTPLAVLVLDIDRFKRINDHWGHATGDVVIKMTANICASSVRPSDPVGRLGGEEFCIVLARTGLAEATITAERLRQKLSESWCTPIDASGLRSSDEATSGIVRFTISIGVAEATVDKVSDLDELIAIADRRLYRAKESGRNRVVGSDEATDLPAPAVG